MINSTNSSLGTNSGTPLNVKEILAITFVCILVPFIICSNVLVIVVVVRFKRLQIPTNYFVLSLAGTDVFIAVMIPLVTTADIYRYMESEHVCIASRCILMAMCGVSVLNLAAIACDRYLAVANPLEYVTRATGRRSLIIITCSWFYALLINSAPIMGWYKRNHMNGTCSFTIIHKNAVILVTGLLFGPACLVIFFCYFRIYTIARHHALAIAAVETSLRRNLEVRFIIKDTKYAKTLAIVIGVFLLLWLPVAICVVVEISSDIYVDDWTRTYLSYLAYINSGINPWIYAYKNNDFRAAYKRIYRELLLHFQERQHRRGSTASDTSVGQEQSVALSRTNSRISAFDIRRFRLYNQIEDSPTATINATYEEDVFDSNYNKIRNVQKVSYNNQASPSKISSQKKVVWTTTTVFNNESSNSQHSPGNPGNSEEDDAIDCGEDNNN